MADYRILTGLNYGNRRVEPGDVVSDLPAAAVKWLVEQGAIERVERTGRKADER